MKRALLLWAGIAVFAGCHHAPPPVRVEGSSTFTFVEPPPLPVPANVRAEVGGEPQLPADTLLLAMPIEPLAKPVYPPAVLGRESMPVIVGVRITVDAAGRVSDVRTSLAVMSTPTPRAAEFRIEVERALAQWRFRPAELRHLIPTKDSTGAPAWALLSREKTDCVFDLSFVFQSTGEVVSRGLK